LSVLEHFTVCGNKICTQVKVSGLCRAKASTNPVFFWEEAFPLENTPFSLQEAVFACGDNGQKLLGCGAKANLKFQTFSFQSWYLLFV